MVNSLGQLLCLASPVLAPDVAGIIAPDCCNAASQDCHHCADKANTEVPNIKRQTTSNGTDGVGNLQSKQSPITGMPIQSACGRLAAWPPLASD